MHDALSPRVLALDAEGLAARLEGFCDLMQACVSEGASIGYIMPFGRSEAESFWREKVMPGVARGKVGLFFADIGGTVAGSVQIDCDTPPNQPHRAEVKKLLVHPRFRRQGLARALMAAIDDEARRRGRTLLTLDTRSGDSAEKLYRAIGFREVGTIPRYCIDALDPSRFDSTTLFRKEL
ncbi:MAG: GNAT family N-acetyltransferase [Rhizobiaceae bacterium]